MKRSKTDWTRVKREARVNAPVSHDPKTDLYDPNDPAAVEGYWEKAVIRRPGARGPQKSPTKIATAIRLDAEVLEAFRASGPRWQTRINAILKNWLKKHKPAA